MAAGQALWPLELSHGVFDRAVRATNEGRIAMEKSRLTIGFVVLTALICSTQSVHAEAKTGKAMGKLARGTVNIVTGWVELPKRMHETSLESGVATGLTWGLLRGLGYGFVRTAAGFYELFTFPFPAPPDYQPVMRPEYVFLDDDPTAASSCADEPCH